MFGSEWDLRLVFGTSRVVLRGLSVTLLGDGVPVGEVDGDL